ncbi:flagellar motor switch protein FliG [Tepidamorphus sp. 3E244]|uniref:flagellar motor switch protein FliG n=1 Tax=Tepidamorphus sp. 3E244 TaxID=3385498 RepID=UPI0038FC963B
MSQQVATIDPTTPTVRDIDANTPLTSISGSEKAAIVLLALGQEHGRAVWAAFDDDEVRRISIAMSRLGKVSPEIVEQLLGQYIMELGKAGALVGNFENTERLLVQFLPEDRVNAIMEEIRGPAGRTMWEKLSNVQEDVLANYLKNEYPQTIAVVLSKIRAEHASRVLSILPEELALDVVARMLRMESIQKDILDKIEQTLRIEFMANLSQTRRRDAHELMADIFNNFDRQTESRFLTALEEDNREAADRIKQLMFTFDDLGRLDAAGMQTLMRSVDKDKLAIALKGASEKMRDFFMENMSQRAAKMLQEDMDVLGPVRLKDVDEAQGRMVNMAKDLAARGEIQISKKGGEDEMVY